ncbi:uncharacterized protein LOC115014955 isoform X2 [Cottoperca gobio]|uniref:Uncharacterized protein LOC115014955 isoform X2 n=1 Tax=Cottoperca gobio TaxID=56716 RepID=A0A6J2QK20_COTGO|nr:uncharacterized protein LOC115014955 isoform X2 [Cottoperca gobio]
MRIVFYLLLMLRVGRSTDDQNFETKTVGVGDDVRLTCPRKLTGNLFWIRLVSGAFPQVYSLLGNRITATKEPGTLDLHIKDARLSDAAVYYCMKIYKQNFTFLKGTDLRVEDLPSDPVRPGDSVTLQCSVLSDSENKTCAGQHSVFWFRVGSHQCCPNFNYTQGNGVEEQERNPEGLSTKKCIDNFFKNVSSSDAGTFYCAVATCGEIFTGNRSKLDTEVNMWDPQKANTVLILLCSALAISVFVIAFLTYSVKKLKERSCAGCNTAVALQAQATTASGDQQRQQTDEDSLIYSAPTFTGRKANKAATRDAKTEEEESIYTDVRALRLDS